MAFNVLIVDDSDVIRSMIAKTLRLAQVSVANIFEAGNGKEALAILQDTWVDFVLADINMPVMNGAEMITRMRACPDTADIPVIVVSSEGATDRVDALSEAGVCAWIRKPFTPEEIRDVVGTLVRSWPVPNAQHAHIDAVLCPVLETFAFVFPEPTELEQLPAAGEDLVCASIAFQGAATGTLTVAAPSELCVELAANILGIDVDDPDALLRGADTLGEIANIAAGHLATRINASETTDLHPPVVSRMQPVEWARHIASSGAAGYLIEGRPVVVTLGLRTLQPAV